MEDLLLAGPSDVALECKDFYFKVSAKHWEEQAEAALRAKLEQWLR